MENSSFTAQTQAPAEKPMVRIGNCSGFMGDRFMAAREMIDGGPIDVLTGDYLAELTMGALGMVKETGGSGYADNFLFQAQQILADCIERRIKIVVNAGGVNPSGLAQELQAFADRSDIPANIAYIDGDDLLPRLSELQEDGELFTNFETGEPLSSCERPLLTANAYLGGWGIKEALDHGADVVIAPRTTDASLVVGAAAWHFGWARDDLDALAGAVAAGHVIECGPHACGGNYSFFREVPSFKRIGFPIAEMFADGSSIITKHPGTGGVVTVGTVTEQLLYETNAPTYLNPDVICHLDSLRLTQECDDRVRISGTRGSSPTTTHKVCITTDGGYKTTFVSMIAGAYPKEKAKLMSDAMFDLAGGREKFDSVTEELILSGHDSPSTNEEAFSTLRITVKSTQAELVGAGFTAHEMELALSSIPGMVPSPMSGIGLPWAQPFSVHWPTLIDSRFIRERVHINGENVEVIPTNQLNLDEVQYNTELTSEPSTVFPEATVRIRLGDLYGTRSGDKGRHANLGVYARSDAAYTYLQQYLTIEKFQQLLPDTTHCEIDRYRLDNIRAMNFFVQDYLEEGVAAATRIDGCGKSFGEYLGCQWIEVPVSLAMTIQD